MKVTRKTDSTKLYEFKSAGTGLDIRSELQVWMEV